jgi:hypothetical protein
MEEIRRILGDDSDIKQKTLLLVSREEEERLSSLLHSLFPSASTLTRDEYARIDSLKGNNFDTILATTTLPFSTTFLQHVLQCLSPGGRILLLVRQTTSLFLILSVDFDFGQNQKVQKQLHPVRIH